MKMNRLMRYVLILLAAAGIGFSLYLTLFHIWKILDPNYVSLCEINQELDCDAVNTSRYAKLWSLPLGLYGLGFYALVLVLSGMSFSSREKLARCPEVIFGISSLAVLVSLALVYISHVIIGAFCLFCMVLWCINLAIWISSFLASGGGPLSVLGRLEKELAGFYRSPPVYVSALVFAGVVLLGGSYYRVQERNAKDYAAFKISEGITSGLGPGALTGANKPTDPTKPSLQDVQYQIERTGHEATRGNENSPITITVFSDFECPFCQGAASSLEEVQAQYASKVLLVFKHYPLDYDCNPYLKSSMHPDACRAAIASVCAHRQGKFWKMHDILFTNQRHLAEKDIRKYADEAGLDLDRFSSCLEDRSVVLEISADIEEAHRLRVRGTPSIFVNGHQWKGPADAELISDVIDKMLNR